MAGQRLVMTITSADEVRQSFGNVRIRPHFSRTLDFAISQIMGKRLV